MESAEIFGLQEGAFQEKKYHSDYIAEISKERNRADFIIRIDVDIQIPIEVEKYGNIKAGIEQIARYQAVWDMKYGILTDGYEWRFYIGSRYRTLTLDEILSDDTLFQTFWAEYTKQENYYLIYFDHTERGELFEAEPQPIADKQIGIFFFDNTTTLIRKLRDKLNLEKYFTQAKDDKEREKNATEITYAYIIQFILYKALVDNNFSEFSKTYSDIREAITQTLKNPSSMAYNGILNLITKMAEKISADIYRPFADEQKFIGEKLSAILSSPKNEITDISPWLDMFIFIDSFSFANIQNEIFGHVYENYLKELYAEENRGQYFTHPAVVDFMLKEIGYTPETVKAKGYKNISIIDPSCGRGTFLYKITDILVDSFGSNSAGAEQQLSALVHENVFGLDIEEFPLYLAEMSILMRMLPYILGEKHNNAMDKKIKVFKTKDSVAEFLGETQESDTLFTTDIDLGYHSFMRDEQNLSELKDSLKGQNWKDAQNGSHPPRQRFDFVIGNPPYIGGIDCIRQKVKIYSMVSEKRIKLNSIYGINMHSVPLYPKKQAPLSNLNLWNMFIPLGYGLLKEEGKLCYIIPQNLLHLKTTDVLRYMLTNKMLLEKIIIFPDKLFTYRGIKTKKDTTTSSLIFIAKKDSSIKNKEDSKVTLIKFREDDLQKYKNDIGKYIAEASQEINIVKQSILNNSLEWISFFSKKNQRIFTKYKQNSVPIKTYYDHAEAKASFGTSFYFDGFYEYDISNIKLTYRQNDYTILNINDIAYYTFSVPYSSIQGYFPNKREDNSENPLIKLRQANQEYNLLDSPYKIIWQNARTKRFLFCERSDILLWGQNYSGIGGQDKSGLLYLFILLNSNTTCYILNTIAKNNNEKINILVQVATIKNFVRVPIITPQNQPLKDRLIVIAQSILDAEKYLFKDCIEFGSYMQQSIDSISLQGSKLMINSGGKNIALALKAGISTARIEHNLNLYLKEHKKDMDLLSFKNFPCIDNKAITCLMAEANDIV